MSARAQSISDRLLSPNAPEPPAPCEALGLGELLWLITITLELPLLPLPLYCRTENRNILHLFSRRRPAKSSQWKLIIHYWQPIKIYFLDFFVCDLIDLLFTCISNNYRIWTFMETNSIRCHLRVSTGVSTPKTQAAPCVQQASSITREATNTHRLIHIGPKP